MVKFALYLLLAGTLLFGRLALARPQRLAQTGRVLRAGERTRILRQLDQERRALNATGKALIAAAEALRQDSLRLQAQVKSPSASEQAHYQLLWQHQRQGVAEYKRRRDVYRQNKLALQRGYLPIVPASR